MPISFNISHVVSDLPDDAIDVTYDIRYSIVVGTLLPGEFLPQAGTVAREIGVAIARIDAAYEELARIGLLVRDGDRLRTISDYTGETAQENLRYVLERRLRDAIQAAARAGYEPARIQALLGDALDAEFGEPS